MKGNTTVTFTYDWQGRRVSLSANVSGNVTTENFLWDGDSIVQRRDGGTGSSNTTREYFGDGYVAINGSTWSYYYYTRDHLGSIREVVASDGKTVEGRYSYGPWGETTYMDYSGGAVAQPDFGYAGYMQTSFVSGLYFTPNRVYSTADHRWLSRDPIGEAGGANLYGYGGNDPIDWSDPSGLIAPGAGKPGGWVHGYVNQPWNGYDTAAVVGLGLAPAAVVAAPDILMGATSVGIAGLSNPIFQSTTYYGLLASAALIGYGIEDPEAGDQLKSLMADFGDVFGVEGLDDDTIELKSAGGNLVSAGMDLMDGYEPDDSTSPGLPYGPYFPDITGMVTISIGSHSSGGGILIPCN
jgi:RHS repeat-associated protein